MTEMETTAYTLTLSFCAKGVPTPTAVRDISHIRSERIFGLSLDTSLQRELSGEVAAIHPLFSRRSG
jgi:hypothetical protein